MRHLPFLLIALLLAAGTVAALAKRQPAGLVVHEWGTFLAMAGSDGVTLDGMYHEEHALPGFVHARGTDQLRLPTAILKGETPVIYFYTPDPVRVRVEVRFPQGIWTQWYPQAAVLAPALSQAAAPGELRGGRIVWCADVLPPRESSAPAPPTTPPGALWNHARAVDAAFVRTEDRTRPGSPAETERYLFYRGLGEAPLPLHFAATSGGTLRGATDNPAGLRHLFVLRVENGRAAYRYLPVLRAGERVSDVIPSLDGALPVAEFKQQLADHVAARLAESGLYAREARAMVDTWRESYFGSEGVRVLFVLPQSWTDRFIPLTITPTPRKTVRVMVGRVELLTPERERAAEAAVRRLGSASAADRERAFAFLREQGRYVEPVVRRLLASATDPDFRDRCRQLLATDFVTELRAATHAAPDGRFRSEVPAFVRARLAALLREIGLNEEAKDEARQAQAELARQPRLPLENVEARGQLRARARAAEGMGDDAAAVDAYLEFTRFGAQVVTREGCAGGCHSAFGNSGPDRIGWFRDWWAGAQLARAASRSGRTEALIRTQEEVLKGTPGDVTARMVLAYLHRGVGNKTRDAALWAQLEQQPRKTTRR